MSDGLDLLLGDTPGDNGGGNAPDGKGLRAQLEAVLAEKKALSEQLATFQSEARTRSLAGLFEKHQVPTLAADFFPQDAALTDESVTEFVSKYGQLWGAQAAQATTPAPQQQAASAMQQFAAQASTPPVQPLSEEAYRAKFAEAKTKDELMRLIAEHGA